MISLDKNTLWFIIVFLIFILCILICFDNILRNKNKEEIKNDKIIYYSLYSNYLYLNGKKLFYPYKDQNISIDDNINILNDKIIKVDDDKFLYIPNKFKIDGKYKNNLIKIREIEDENYVLEKRNDVKYFLLKDNKIEELLDKKIRYGDVIVYGKK